MEHGTWNFIMQQFELLNSGTWGPVWSILLLRGESQRWRKGILLTVGDHMWTRSFRRNGWWDQNSTLKGVSLKQEILAQRARLSPEAGYFLISKPQNVATWNHSLFLLFFINLTIPLKSSSKSGHPRTFFEACYLTCQDLEQLDLHIS